MVKVTNELKIINFAYNIFAGNLNTNTGTFTDVVLIYNRK